jgi:cytidine deaminase
MTGKETNLIVQLPPTDPHHQAELGFEAPARPRGKERPRSRPTVTVASEPAAAPVAEAHIPVAPAATAYQTEIVIAFVAPTGLASDGVLATVEAELSAVGYRCRTIRLSDFLRGRYAGDPGDLVDEQKRIRGLQDAGDALRRAHGDGALGAVGVSAIRQQRAGLVVASADIPPEDVPAQATAYLVWSLKHPDEADLLRRVYGSRLVVISVHQSKQARRNALVERIAASRHRSGSESEFLGEAETLIARDEGEGETDHGQDVGDVYPLADLFVDATDGKVLEDTVHRGIRLLFGHPFLTPTRDEYSMYVAHASALRSAEMGRQVGASIATSNGEIIATGTNEVPRAGGGEYWAGDAVDAREYTRSVDSNDLHKRELAEQLVAQLERAKLLKTDAEVRDRVILDALERTKLHDVIEYSRAIHAEMSALMDAARRGVSVAGASLYTTTFPCHLCTGLIIAAGIARVVYIYPYPKSLALALHADSVVADAANSTDRIPFEPYLGVAPRAYIPLFTQSRATRKTKGGKPVRWIPADARFRLVEQELTREGDVPDYIEREQLVEDDASWLDELAPQREDRTNG